MNPVILAAGRGQRYKGDTIKPLMVVKDRPVLLEALHTVSGMGFESDETYIAVNENNRSAIRQAIGNGAINLVTQREITGPATAVKEIYDTNPQLDELLVIQADDAAWLNPIARDFAQLYDRQKPLASMALLAAGDPDTHVDTYEINYSGMIATHRLGLPEQRHHRQGCNAGIYVTSRDSFMEAYDAVGPPHNNDVGLPVIMKHLIDVGLPVAGPVYETPWKSANTVEGLSVARAIYSSTRSVSQ